MTLMGLLCSLALSTQFLLLFSSSLFTNCLSLNDSTTTHHHECHQHESNALLSFKQSFIISKYASYNPFSYPKTLSWIPTTDCCLWDGIECDELTGHVISIDLSSSQLYGSMDANSTLFSLVHLQSLDLSDNDFNHSQIPARIGHLSQLRHLNLSQVGETTLSGEVPTQISHLSNLLSLDLRIYIEQLDNPFINRLQLKESTLRSLIQNSTRLEQLCLDFVTISSSLPHTLTNLTSLQKLSFSQCELYGEFPIGIFSLANLTSLNFAENQNLQGTLPASIGNLTNLAYLNLEDNSFHGEIPRSLFGLENLVTLHLASNLFDGRLTLDMFLKLKMLNVLELSFNKLSLFSQNRDVNVTILPPIQTLGLGWCNLAGEVPTWIMNLTTLSFLDLSRNNLQGEIPYFFFRLEHLTVLDLSGNLLEGQIELDMLSKLQKLTILGLGGGNKLYFLEGKNTSNITFPSQIQSLILSSCNFVHFPNFIQHLQELTDLFISDNSIKTIPSWLWNKTTLQTLELSNNLLMGEISPFICNLQSLVYLDLSSNNLVGMIPSCLGSFSQSLQYLSLAGNKLTGNIPQTYVKGNALQLIDFSSNKLYGQLPRALVNCRMLEVLAVSHNHFNDSFPFWLGSLPKLKVVSLRDNEFHGAIMCPLKYTFPQLRIMDLSQNGFSMKLTSEIIMCFKSMIISNKRQLEFKDEINYSGNLFLDIDLSSFSMSNKGVVMDYLGGQYLHHMVAIDLSSNKIYGEIPDIMGSLNRLVVLNLSNNMFTGSIPSSFGKLSNLEVLDLSLNSLSGNIPQQLTGLTFLDFFNVSFNNLSGPIPENGQFLTFDDNSFEGNKDLCGIRLLKKCEDHPKLPLQKPDGDQDSESGSFFELYWMVILIGYGGGLVAGLALGNAFAIDVFRLLEKIF
ncbi:receptor-like protein 7 isoform X1 [Arachis hypogaea]|uniref:receptor-like protein 7 isoform X1 n=2 Tax=Arachis hypogaea TaxID=3818 RepID=UPI0007AFD503|nr:Receptor-like protein [Arachis hypogaea]